MEIPPSALAHHGSECLAAFARASALRGSIALDLDATAAVPAGAVAGGIIASASVRALRRLTAAARERLARRYLVPREIERYERLAPFSKRQLEWLGGRLATKRSVVELMSRSGTRRHPREIEIFQDAQSNRPYVNDPGVHVGITHSVDVALGAAAPYPIGIDVERVRPLPDELVEYAFTASEIVQVGSDDTAIALLWCLKEAFLKMLGLGVAWMEALRLVSWARGEPQWFAHGRVAEELAARKAHCWAATTRGYAIALTWCACGHPEGSHVPNPLGAGGDDGHHERGQ